MPEALRILQVGSSMPNDWGGIERYVTSLSRGLIARGHDLTITAPVNSPLAEKSKVHIRYLKVARKYDFPAVGRYMKLFKQIQYDIVNTHFSPDYLVPAWAAKIVGQKGMILTRHLVLPLKPNRARSYSKLYNHFIAVSQAAKDAMVASGIGESHISVPRAGIEPLKVTQPRPSVRESLAIPETEFAIGVFGRLTLEKGQLELVATAPILHDSCVIHVFGDGPIRGRLEQESTLQKEKIRIHGSISDVANAMFAMDTIVVPSLWAEAFSIGLLEAISLGKPIVASPVGGIPEVICNGKNGLLANPKNPEELASTIERFRSNLQLQESCGRAAKELFDSTYRQSQFAERVESTYNSVISQLRNE